MEALRKKLKKLAIKFGILPSYRIWFCLMESNTGVAYDRTKLVKTVDHSPETFYDWVESARNSIENAHDVALTIIDLKFF